MKLFDSEWKVMDELWENGDLSAKELSQRLNSCVGWNKNTTSTVIKKCVDKGAIARLEPNFICHALISRREETQALLDRAFDGSAELLMVSTSRPGNLVARNAGAAAPDD